MVRIGGGDLPTIVVDPKNEKVVYSASTVFWRTEDAGLTWTAVRGAPGGDDYQKAWVNPVNPDIILLVADQGGVVSANRGASWSNWYNQPTAAMYHVSTDNAFPYRVCGGQQDSGSACVDSRSSDGEITFHDWHPINVQEYGVAAPDPKDPDLVFGSARTNVSLWNRRTAQTTQVGPDASARGTEFGRNVRTMPIQWSPTEPGVLYYTSNAVWRSADHAHSWTRISPDLTRATWAVPASAGKYASGVTPAPAGSLTGLSVSPKKAGVIWTGSDDGVIQVTTNGGKSWTNVTPPAIKPWTRIFNIEAGHFDAGTAYAAANTMRIDDMNPHFWRTHDGGKSWTEINTDIAPGSVSNSIREDPRKPGLLFASTDVQVWYSVDDGDHWQSLRNDMPAISVRDLQVKDDSTCMCSDLIAGTHGRGFWILDDITPFREHAEAEAATSAYLFKPATAVRVRFATNDPTPWPPELPAGENPPDGAIIDYLLKAAPASAVKLEILDKAGKVVRTYSSTDLFPDPDPARDPAAYNKLCQETPGAPDCDLPLYWPAPVNHLGAQVGMHRFLWDMRYDPLEPPTATPAGEDAQGAVPHRTTPSDNAPWAPPGSYTVRLTVDGKQYSQPIVVKLDPRVRIAPATLAQVNALTLDLYGKAVALRGELHSARAMSATLNSMNRGDATAMKAQVDSIAPPASTGRGRRGGFGGPPQARAAGAPVPPPSLEAVMNSAFAAAMSMQNAESAPTSGQLAAASKAQADYADVMKRWTALKKRLPTGVTR